MADAEVDRTKEQRMDTPVHEDLARLLNELAVKGFRPAQLQAVRSEWEAACQAGAHPDLAAAAHAEFENGRHVSRLAVHEDQPERHEGSI